MTISYDESLWATLEYFNGDELAAKVWVDKYALRNEKNELLEKTPTDMHWRLANELARIESTKFKKPLTAEQIFDYLDKYERIVPQGSPMAGIGDKYRYISLSSCFVVSPPFDSYPGIFYTDQQIANISKRRGGIGYDISTLRPEGEIVNNSAKTTTGAISFMHRFSCTGREVGQKNRRAAQMITLSIHHPDIEKFIEIKNDLTKVTGANISVRLTDEFLQAVKNNTEYELKWPVNSNEPKISRMTNAKDIWNKIINSVWKCAEPGLLNWPKIIDESPADCYNEFGFTTTSTNPCAELPLSNYDSCRLLCLNLFSYVKNLFTSKSYFDYQQFYEDAQIAQRLIDDIIDLELECIDRILKKIDSDPEPANIKQTEKELWENIEITCRNGRRTGVGITGLGDAIAGLGLKYGSWKSIETASKIYQTLKFGCYRSSIDMAKEIGTFLIWDKKLENNNPFLNRIKDEKITLDCGQETVQMISGQELYNDMQKYGRRNIALLTIAPAGTTSLQTQTTSGIEPVFKLSYIRRKKLNPDDKISKVDFIDKLGDKWQEFTIHHHGLQKWMSITGKNDIEQSPYFGACAGEIDWKNRIKLQAVIQKHCDNSISSTINLPSTTTVEEISNIYEMAWKEGLKGITVYREGSRDGVLIDSKSKTNKVNADKRPRELPCEVHHISVQHKPYFILVGMFDDFPYEVFAGKNGNINTGSKTGKIIKVLRPKYYKAVLDDGTEISPITIACTEEQETITRLVSLNLRHQINLLYVVEQLEKIQGDLTNFAKAIARVLKKYIPDGTKVSKKCPECGEFSLERQSGCTICRSCPFSLCS